MNAIRSIGSAALLLLFMACKPLGRTRNPIPISPFLPIPILLAAI